MNGIRQFWFRLRGSARKTDRDAAMSEEMQQHLELLVERDIRSGMPPADALEAAQRRFGGVDQVKERCREEHRLRGVEDFLRDIHFAVRCLRKNPGFTFAMVATLAIGIGATTAIVTIGRSAVFPFIPYPESERLVIVTNADSYDRQSQAPFPFFSFSYRFAALRQTAKSFSSLGAERFDQMNLVLNGVPAPAKVDWVSGDFFGVLGAKLERGRFFVPGDFDGTRGDVAILDWGFWTNRLGGDPNILGRDIYVGGKSRHVVGILAKTFRMPVNFSSGEVFLPEGISPTSGLWPFRWLQVVGRLKAGISRKTAQAEMNLIPIPGPSGADATFLKGINPRLVPLAAYYGIGREDIFWIFLGAVGFLYAISCSNAASLMLTRTIGRRRELGIRLAMGGSRRQIARLLIAESLVLSLSGGAIGLIIAWWSYSASKRLFNVTAGFDWAVLAIALVLSVVTCCVVVFVPMTRIQNARLNDVLKEGAGSLGDSRRLGRLRACFVVVQAALAVVLLTGAGVMARSFIRLQHVNLGLDPSNKIAVSGILPEDISPKAYLQLANRTREVLNTLPGVKDATVSLVVPFTDYAAAMSCKIDGRPELGSVGLSYNRVSPEYFATLGVPILRGHGFEGMRAGDPLVAVINQAAARLFFGSSSPIGRYLDCDKDGKLEIVGVAGDVKDKNRREASPQVYCPFWQPPVNTGMLFVLLRMNGQAGPDFEAQVRRAAYDVEPRMIVNLNPLSTKAEAGIRVERDTMLVLQVLSAVSLILATTGLFAVMAFSVAQQNREFGLRMALGAAPADLMRSVLARGLRLASLGVVLGLCAAWGLMSLLKSVLYKTSPHDPSTLATAAFLLIAVALLACWLPAKRASKIDPALVLRSE